MPELPEVETFMRRALKCLQGETIRKVWAAEDSLVFSDHSGQQIARALKGRTVTGYTRLGKYAWLTLDQGPLPIFHFGMTGNFEVFTDERPRFSKLALYTEGSEHLAYINKRRIGRVYLSVAPLEHPRLAKLGLDVFKACPPPKAFAEIVKTRKTSIKGLLLNQGVFAGIGNWIADEVLYQSGIHPARPASSLKSVEVISLHSCLKKILHHAVKVGANEQQFPSTWLFHRRWGKVKNALTHDKRPLEFDTIAGRTTAWVPGVQK